MLRNFLKVAVRNLLKNKVYVAINIVGLGLALACCIVAYLNSKFNWDFDKHHSQIDNIYKINHINENQGDIREYGRVPMPLTDAINNDFGNVGTAFRLENHVFTARDVEMDKVFNTALAYADKGFLESFTFKVISGDPSAYHRIDEAVVTQEYARKFYGEENPLGNIITVFDDTGMSFNFVISCVVEQPPQNSSVMFELLVNFDNRYRMYDDNVKNNWASFAQNTFMYFEDPNKVESFEPLMDQYLAVQRAARPDFQVKNFMLRPMNTHGAVSREIRWTGLNNQMPTAAVLTPQIMALLILLVACFNFTNTAIANSNRRLKEIGIRKVLGGTRKQLIKQFMTENLTVCFLAMILSVGMAIFLVPAYSSMWEEVNLQISFTDDYRLYIFLAVLLLFTTGLAGLYPSLYISKYRPVNILRGSMSIGGAGMLTKVLLAVQYTLTVIAIFASVAFIQNARYQDSLDMGYDQEQIIGINLLNETQYQKIRASMLSNPSVVAVASAKNHIGRGNYNLTLKNQDLEFDVSMLDVGIGYMELMGLDIVEGRSFSKELEASDSQSSILVNEKMVEEFAWLEPIGQRVIVNDSTTLTVVGVVENFYMYGFWAPLESVGIRLSSLKFQDDGTYSFIVAKTNLNDVQEVYAYLESEWNSKIPNKTFTGFYQNDLLRGAKEVNNNVLTIFSFLGSVAFILSCLGLFTLVSINLIKKTKEIGVRKVLGGGVGHIVFLISRSYFILLLISSVIGVTAGYYLIDALIASIFNNYKAMDLITFLAPTLTIIIVSLTIAALRTLKSATANPVKSLRYE
jgi:ABC-type antimicrobial peptide transport system permease subunit